MTAVYFLIFSTLILLALLCLVFFWAIKNNQLNDVERHKYDIFLDEEEPVEKSETHD